jgi:hypothetical protein
MQITDTLLMVRPANFGFNPETASNNAFQINDMSITPAEIQAKALAEFDGLVNTLREKGIHIIVANDTALPVKTDAIFPNNWVTFHDDGMVITYPMFSPNRRLERSDKIIQLVENEHFIHQKKSFIRSEKNHKYLEGTGSLVLDRVHKIAYACLSVRTNERLLDEFCATVGYQKMIFHAVDANNLSIYHTNVMMALGETFVIICMDTIQDAYERAMLEASFMLTQKKIIKISLMQMEHFAGNMLQVASKTGEKYLIMSEKAHKSLTQYQKKQIKKHTNILHSPLYTIEQYGGGGARCMLAEVFLPKK